jgi:hypothetical protein
MSYERECQEQKYPKPAAINVFFGSQPRRLHPEQFGCVFLGTIKAAGRGAAHRFLLRSDQPRLPLLFQISRVQFPIPNNGIEP